MKVFGWVVAVLAIAAAATGAVLVAMGKIVLPVKRTAEAGVGGGSKASPSSAVPGSPTGGQVATGGTAKPAGGQLAKIDLSALKARLVAHLPTATQQPAQQLLDSADQSAVDALNAEAQAEGWA